RSWRVAKTCREFELRKGSHRGARPPPEKPVINFTPSCSKARTTASAPRMVSLPSYCVLQLPPPVWRGHCRHSADSLIPVIATGFRLYCVRILPRGRRRVDRTPPSTRHAGDHG